MEKTILTANYLQNIAHHFPTTNPHQKLLKSFLLSKLAKFETKHIQKIGHTNKCNKCFTDFTPQNFQMTIRKKKNRRKKHQKLVDAYEKNQLEQKSQKVAAEKYQKLVHNIMVVKCLVCNNIVKTAVRKIPPTTLKDAEQPKKIESVPIVHHPIAAETKPIQKTKKHKKDPFAGLNREVILKRKNETTKSVNINQSKAIKSTTETNINKKPQTLPPTLKKKLKTQSIINAERKMIAKKRQHNLGALAMALKAQEQQPKAQTQLGLIHLLKI